ncbi:TPA: hypothetical protein ACTYSP_004219 [Citrobacter freundii]
MTFEITTEIDEEKFIKETEEVVRNDEKFSGEIFEAIDNAALKITEEFTVTQQLEFEDNLNSVLNSSEDSMQVKDYLQIITEKPTYTEDKNELMKKIADMLTSAGDKADPFIRNDPLFKKAIINTTFSMLGVGGFSKNFKIAGKVILGGTAAYFVIKTILNYQNNLKSTPPFILGSGIDYVGMFGDFSSSAQKIYEAFILFEKENYFSNLSVLSGCNSLLSNEKIFLLDHAWLLGSSICLFPLSAPYSIDKFDYYNKIDTLSNVLDKGLVAFYQTLHADDDIPLSILLDIGRAAILVNLTNNKGN